MNKPSVSALETESFPFLAPRVKRGKHSQRGSFSSALIPSRRQFSVSRMAGGSMMRAIPGATDIPWTCVRQEEDPPDAGQMVRRPSFPAAIPRVDGPPPASAPPQSPQSPARTPPCCPLLTHLQGKGQHNAHSHRLSTSPELLGPPIEKHPFCNSSGKSGSRRQCS